MITPGCGRRHPRNLVLIAAALLRVANVAIGVGGTQAMPTQLVVCRPPTIVNGRSGQCSSRFLIPKFRC